MGVGRLGRAITGHPSFTSEGFNVVAVFDLDPEQVGSRVGDLVVNHVSRMEQEIKSKDIRITIAAVPGDYAQTVIDQLVSYKIHAILNYSSSGPQVPMGVQVRNIDPIIALQSMTYYLKG